MEAHATTPTTGAHESHRAIPNSLSLAYLLAASILCGVGIFLTSLWMITLDWLFFPGLLLSVLGGLLLFSPRAGSNRAEPA